jgi:hypothetical protein
MSAPIAGHAHAVTLLRRAAAGDDVPARQLATARRIVAEQADIDRAAAAPALCFHREHCAATAAQPCTARRFVR